jgi:hypothetical protein
MPPGGMQERSGLESIMKLFDAFREFLTGLARLFVFWPDGWVLMRRTVAWCRTHDLLEAWIAYWVVGTAMFWALNLLSFTVITATVGDDAPRLVRAAALRAEAQRHLPGDIGLWNALNIQREVMFDPGHLLALDPRQQALTAVLQALAMAALGAAMMGVFIRLLPRLRPPKKQAQVWAFSVAAMPLVCLPMLFASFAALVLVAVWPLPMVLLGFGAVASTAFLVWIIRIGQRAFRLKSERYWLFTAASLMLLGGFSFVGGFSPKPYADVAKAILGSTSAEKAK